MKFLCWLLGHNWQPRTIASMQREFDATGVIQCPAYCARCGHGEPRRIQEDTQ